MQLTTSILNPLFFPFCLKSLETMPLNQKEEDSINSEVKKR